ncbi:hypothetical protein LguiA_006660 [Lonicera macranthoides]
MAIKSKSCTTRNVTTDGKREMTMDEFKRWLKKFDTDNDSRISRDELREAVRANGGWFSKWKGKRGMKSADINGNGFIDESEIISLLDFAEKVLGVRIVAY